MLYVINVFENQEEKAIKEISKTISPEIVLDVFTPKRVILKKYLGSMHEERQLVFPGYIFIETLKPKELNQSLKKITSFTKLLGMDKNKDEIVPLYPMEEDFLYSLMGKDPKHEITLSKISVKEGKKIVVLDGPLKNMEGIVYKVNLHKRQVTILVNILGQQVETILGIDIVKEIEDC